LLLDHGHPEAAFYPLGVLVDEARLTSERLSSFMATQAVLTQMAASTLFSKESFREFQKMIARLTDGQA
jgi:hypothetical protein